MALSKKALKSKIIKEMNAQGMVTDGPFAKAGNLAEAIANAVVDEIQANAAVNVSGGSSKGNYKVT